MGVGDRSYTLDFTLLTTMQAQSSLSVPRGTLLFPDSDGDDGHV